MGTYNIHAGHGNAGGLGCGACGILNESTEARKVKDLVIKYLRAGGHTVYDCTYNGNASQNTILAGIVKACNSHAVDLDVSIHLNSGRNDYAGDGSTGGVEVYGYDNGTQAVGSAICEKISGSLGIRNRGFKTTKNLYFLNKTKAQAILIECCFVDDKDDAAHWNADKCAKAIVEAITGKAVKSGSSSGGSSTAKKTTAKKQTASGGYLVRVTATALNIRAGAGTNYKINGVIRDKGTYTIVETKGNWGRLKSGAGWICLDYTVRV